MNKRTCLNMQKEGSVHQFSSSSSYIFGKRMAKLRCSYIGEFITYIIVLTNKKIIISFTITIKFKSHG